MAIKRVTTSGAVTVLVGSRPYGYDPTWKDIPVPTARNTVTFATVTTANTAKTANILASAPPVGRHGSFTVSDNDFSTGRMELVVGDMCLLSDVDFVVGALAGDTATNIAAAINAVGGARGYGATVLGAVVTVTAAASLDMIDFYARHYGQHVNLDTFTPGTGLLGGGDPFVGPLELT